MPRRPPPAAPSPALAFGELLRQTRHGAGKTMRDLARWLSIPITTLSEVEIGQRPPLTASQIVRAALFLRADTGPLFAAARASRAR